ncbi:MAG: histidine--tRNA ligase [Spirochaetales bacterium]|nr:histidine--tRNA ligase [Spirochaetales bacterium]MCF7937165.1 histidine--tRNA ligase [Spirochaetales bacterium]
MKRIEPRVLKGFRDFLPENQRRRIDLQKQLEKTFRSYGFVPIDTPVLEYTEVLLGKGGGDTDKQIYRFQDNGGRDVSMRFDLTVPFARYMAAHRSELYLPFRRYHIDKVWRGENTQRGRYREFAQCDFDIVGPDSGEADLEILLLMRDALASIGIENISIRVAHRGLFNRFLSRLGVEDKSVEILRLVDKVHKIGREELSTQLTELVDSEKASAIISYISPQETGLKKPASSSENFSVIDMLEESAGGQDEDSSRLRYLFEQLEASGNGAAFRIDPSITRGLDYYTGVVFETFLEDLPSLGSVCSGGRYNDLAGLYTKESLPGVGSSIGLDRLIAGMEELGISGSKTAVCEVLILNFSPSLSGAYHRLARALRNAGISCEIFPEAKKLGAQFQYAEKKGIPYALIMGEEEHKRGTVNLKNITTRENEDDLTPSDAAERLRRYLSHP